VELFHIGLQLIEQLLFIILCRADVPVTGQALRLPQVVDLHPMGNDRSRMLLRSRWIIWSARPVWRSMPKHQKGCRISSPSTTRTKPISSNCSMLFCAIEKQKNVCVLRIALSISILWVSVFTKNCCLNNHYLTL
jgi:hypothetical protein